MANLSVLAAFLERLENLTGGAAYFDEVPAGDDSGNIPAFPYVVLKDDGTNPEYTLEYDVVETNDFTIDVFASASTLEPTVRLIKYGSSAYNASGGMDFCDLTVTNQTVLSVVRQNEQRFLEGMRDGSGKLAYRCRLKYRVESKITG